ncbi:elongation factor Ts [Psychromonas sp. RZ22]|nr:elongation factor Ts [Psychromonas sp. RZ22]
MLIGCGSDSSSFVPGAESVTYRLTFSTDWDATNFPTNFPNNRHFSRLIGVNHNDKDKLFRVGEAASSGIVSMAETGSTSRLAADINLMQNVGYAEVLINGPELNESVDSVEATLYVSPEFPLVTLVTMVAPSPDWFVGVDSQSLQDSNGAWVDKLVVELKVYDAGSDSGKTFTAGNSSTTPVEKVSLLSSARTDTDFQDGVHYSTAKTIGTFTFSKVE